MTTATEANAIRTASILVRERCLTHLIDQLYFNPIKQVETAIQEYVYKAADINGHASKYKPYSLVHNGEYYCTHPGAAPWHTEHIMLPEEFSEEFASLCTFLATIKAEMARAYNFIKLILLVSKSAADIYYLLNSHVHKHIPIAQDNAPISKEAESFKKTKNYKADDELLSERLFTNLLLKNII